MRHCAVAETQPPCKQPLLQRWVGHCGHSRTRIADLSEDTVWWREKQSREKGGMYRGLDGLDECWWPHSDIYNVHILYSFSLCVQYIETRKKILCESLVLQALHICCGWISLSSWLFSTPICISSSFFALLWNTVPFFLHFQSKLVQILQYWCGSSRWYSSSLCAAMQDARLSRSRMKLWLHDLCSVW